MKHTPGPWVKHSTIGKTYANVRGIDGRCVADCGSRCDPVAQANATVIAAAPDMIAHISLMLRTVQDTLRHGLTDGQRESLEEMIKEAQTILRKATGEIV